VRRTLEDGRPEIEPQLNWLLKQPPELNFHFKPSGKLKLRDTSVWPISGIETWPSWLREELFGPGIDLDAAYVQFLVKHLRKHHHDRPNLLQTLYPDLLRLLDDKEAFRQELCEQVLQRPYDERWRGIIKAVIMSIANGSRISPGMLVQGNEYSQTVKLIRDAAPEATPTELIEIGKRLKRIADQFSSARKNLCIAKLQKVPSRANLRSVFGEYFSWERAMRYAIWEAIGRTGIMVHDGIDGVPQQFIDALPELMARLDLRLTS
jgi:hypothetical protein